MSFQTSWHTLLDECDALGDGATLTTPLTDKRFRITSTQDPRIVIEFVDTGDSQPLQREQFETLAGRITDAGGTFELQRLPPDAEPYAAVLSLHPRYECNERAGTLTETDEPTTSQLIKGTATSSDEQPQDRTEPDLDLYADMLLLIDALERQNPLALEESETPALINLYTLLSDVQRNAGDLRTAVREVLLERLHHDQPVHGQYGSVQRTIRRNRTLNDDDEVLGVLEEAGIPRERLLSVNQKKVDEALEVTELAESAVYEIDERAYIRKAEVDEERKDTRLQGLKDQLALSDEPEAEELRAEVAELEQRIEELTEFTPGTEVGTRP
jgi:polyhydroxyalkanoate synthesis regulator phasin